MAKQGIAARRVARDLMTAVTGEGRLLSDILPRLVRDLPPEERARAQRLATESLRWAGRSDRLLGPYLRQRPVDAVLNTLRLALWEMLGDGAATHGVVDSAVEMTRQTPDTRRSAGMVNAVLRNVLRGEPDWDAMPVPPLPKWLRKPLVGDYGKEIVAEMEIAHARGAPLDLTPRGGDADTVAQMTGGTVLPTGSVRVASAGQVSAMPGYSEGAWWVQDAAAALPVRLLRPRPGERVLDLCAAPGGKTLQLADAGAAVTALDISGDRLSRVAENLARTGFTADLVTADALVWEAAEPFDAVLLDAPCTATGTIRRHPDLPFAKSLDGFEDVLKLQSALFDRAVALTRPGGRLVFCTCSLLKDEGEGQLDAALERHPGLVVERPADLPDGWINPVGAVRLRPDFWAETGGMDGFFIACLQKPA